MNEVIVLFIALTQLSRVYGVAVLASPQRADSATMARWISLLRVRNALRMPSRERGPPLKQCFWIRSAASMRNSGFWCMRNQMYCGVERWMAAAAPCVTGLPHSQSELMTP